MADSLFSSSRFLYTWFSLVIVRVTDLGCRRLHHPSCDSLSRELVRLLFLLREQTRLTSPAGPTVPTWPVRLARSTSIIVKEVAARAKLHGLLSPFSIGVRLRHARYSRANLALKVTTRRDNPTCIVRFIDLASITKLTRIPISRKFPLLRWKNCAKEKKELSIFSLMSSHRFAKSQSIPAGWLSWHSPANDWALPLKDPLKCSSLVRTGTSVLPVASKRISRCIHVSHSPPDLRAALGTRTS